MFRTSSVPLVFVSILALVGCGGSDPGNLVHVDPATWCDHVAGGPSGANALPVDLSQAHAGIRFFAAELDGGTADVALADALDAPDALSDAGIAATLKAYKAPLLQVCVVPADDRPLPVASVEMKGAVAIIHPGTGEITVPSNAAAIAVDLRDLPNRPDLESVLFPGVEASLTGTGNRAQYLVAEDYGLPPELSAYTGIYSVSYQQLYPAPLQFHAAENLPVAVITGARMGFEATELAANLRLLKKAWIFGEDVRMAVAESCWQGVGNQGVAYRCRELSSGGSRWPDVIAADAPTAQLDSALQSLLSRGPMEGVPANLPADRPFLQLQPSRPEPTTSRLGDARAALITSHGAAVMFDPEAPRALQPLNGALVTQLDALPTTPPDRGTTRAALQALAHVLDDGQAFASDEQDTSTDRLPLVLEQVAGAPVVLASGDAGVHRGDQVTQVNGVDFATWYAQQSPELSAGTDSYRLERALDALTRLGSATLTLTDPGGTARTVTVTAQPIATLNALRDGAQRASGLLAGTNDYYLNADGATLKTAADLTAALKAAATADGLILDLRGHPTLSPYAIAAGVITKSFQSPKFHVPVWRGREELGDAPFQTSFPPDPNVFGKKVVVLIDASTLSDAEVTATAIVDSVDYPTRVKLVGRNSGGTAGNVSAIRVPGGFDFGFTSMRMEHADGSAFVRIGIAPNVTAEPTQADVANGVDTALQVAQSTLAGM